MGSTSSAAPATAEPIPPIRASRPAWRRAPAGSASATHPRRSSTRSDTALPRMPSSKARQRRRRPRPLRPARAQDGSPTATTPTTTPRTSPSSPPPPREPRTAETPRLRLRPPRTRGHPPARPRLLDQAFADRLGHSLRACARVELGDDVVDDVLDRPLAVAEPPCDLARRVPGGDEPQHLLLARGQA